MHCSVIAHKHCIEETLMSDEMMYCGLDNEESHQNQDGDELKFYTW